MRVGDLEPGETYAVVDPNDRTNIYEVRTVVSITFRAPDSYVYSYIIVPIYNRHYERPRETLTFKKIVLWRECEFINHVRLG